MIWVILTIVLKVLSNMGQAIKEGKELYSAIHKALKDGSLTKEETKGIFKEATDVGAAIAGIARKVNK